MMNSSSFRLPALRTLMVAALLLLLPMALLAATATGTVTLAETEQGLAGVMVSDGVTNIVRTADDGAYNLPLAESARFVMVINPPGCEPTRDFYHRLPEELPEQVTADFVMQPAQRPEDAPFTFVHMTDSHSYSRLPAAERIITAVNSLVDRPVFVMDTGDLSANETGLDPVESYLAMFEMPYFPITGNHDVTRARGMPFAGGDFEISFGPWYYAWYCGNYLFVGLPWSPTEGTLLEAADWLEQLLSMNADSEQAHVMVALHHWDSFGRSEQLERFVDVFREFDTRAIFIGHWHMNRVFEAYGIPNYMSRTPGMSNRDLAPGGFRLMTAYPDGTLDSDFRVLGYKQQVAVASPAEGSEVPRATQPVVVNAYDTTPNVQRVSASAFDAEDGALLQEIELDGSGGSTWLGEIAPDDTWPGRVRLAVTVVDELDRQWPAHEVTFTLADALAPRATGGADWPMVQYDAERTGAGPESVTPPLSLAWAHTTGMAFGQNSPIVVDGTIFASVENNSEPRKPMPSIVALDAVTGEERWTHELAGRVVRGGLAGNSEAICALADDGTVFALDPATGELLWRQTNLVPDPVWTELYNGSPMLIDSTLIAGAGAGLAAYDTDDGRVLWQTSVVSEGGRRWTQDPAPALAGDDVILAWASLHAFARQTGEERWEFEQTFMTTFTPTVADGKVLTVTLVPGEDRKSHNRLLVAVDAATGEEVWTVPMWTRQRGIYASPVVADGTVYAFDSRQLHAVDLETGEVLWQLDLAEADNVTGSPALAGDHLYYVHSDGLVSAIDVAAREIVWSHALGARVDSCPALSGNMLYVAAHDGTLYAFAGVQ
ncbi:MAG: PQQ-binding-like beta-propeller repeat protein [Armatimonadota bacterium]